MYPFFCAQFINPNLDYGTLPICIDKLFIDTGFWFLREQRAAHGGHRLLDWCRLRE